MKKLLIFVALFALSHAAYSQAAQLTIYNFSSCNVYVYFYAIDNNLGDGTMCDIQSSTIMIPAGTTTIPVICTPTSSGFFPYSATSSIGVGSVGMEMSSAHPDWTWTDCQFQYQCTDCGAGGTLGETFSSCAPPLSDCLGGGATWSPSYCSPPVSSTATWNSPGNCIMNNITIDF